jgi:DNA polymerase III epsilon subunit-like protein
MIAPDRRARTQLWSHLRVLVIDLESCVHGGRHRIVSGAALSLVGGKVTRTWHQLYVNPGVPIDAITQSKHGITDDKVKDAPSFSEIAPTLLPHLIQAPGEVLILCAHNARFDIPLLRAELEKAGQTLPDLPVLDTMGAFPPLVRVAPAGRGLEHLAAELGITNHGPHSALGDARAAAEAAAILLDRAADAGYFTIGRLLAKLEAGRTATLRFSRPAELEPTLLPVLSAAHRALDVRPLDPGADQTEIATWLATVEDCARLHCPNLARRVETAGPPGAVLLPLLVERLRIVAGDGDHAAAATLLGALLRRVGELAPATTGHPNTALRTAAAALDSEIALLVAAHKRCVHPNLCPECLVGEPCPLDIWRLAVAPLVLVGAKLASRSASYLPTTGVRQRSIFRTLREDGHEALADAGLRLVWRQLKAAGQNDVADATARVAISEGSLDPEVAEAYALALAVAGRKADLDAGLAVCDRVLAIADKDSSDPAWRGLEVRRSQIGGRLRRLAGRTDGAGNPIRRHHPAKPHRVRVPRFLRPGMIEPTS